MKHNRVSTFIFGRKAYNLQTSGQAAGRQNLQMCCTVQKMFAKSKYSTIERAVNQDRYHYIYFELLQYATVQTVAQQTTHYRQQVQSGIIKTSLADIVISQTLELVGQ